MQWYLKVLQNYVGFSGRARRQEYWMFMLFNTIISIVLTIIQTVGDFAPLLTGLYSVAVLLPSFGVLFRRLHDTGKSGAWFLISLIPIVGAIILLVFTCQDSQPGTNQYGENPKEKTI